MSKDRFFSRTVLFVVDGVLCGAAFLLAYLVRFEGIPAGLNFKQMFFLFPYVVLARLVSNQAFGVYNVVWRYTGTKEIGIFVPAAMAPSLVFLALRFLLPPRAHYGKIPLSIIAVELLLAFFFLLGARVARRLQFEHAQARARGAGKSVKPILLIGAGSAGVIVAREIQQHPEVGLKVVGFVDDDPAKRGHAINGIPVLGTTTDLPGLVRRHGVDHVVISIARGSGADIRRIVGICETIPIRTQIMPGIYELVDGTVNVSRIRDVGVEDLLGREPVSLDVEAIGRFIEGNHILVTGAGGSIGSEMCRQVCRFRPSSLVLVERFENNLFDIERDLRAEHPRIALVPCVADIRDEARMDAIFRKHRPRVVIHAAAHKHVPMMEQNPGEAIKNNVGGTKLLADMADRHGTAAFVMISTDKAVRPTSVMGASKRIAEIYVQGLSRRSRTRFTTVRFGNVLGSVGSVIPIFKEQITKGGPITVTHPEMQRYFMTIPEAAQLVLQAATMGQGGEIYVLDMGHPIRIVTLAEDLIRLSGLRPYEDVDIVFTGVRPGEKLFEEIALNDEEATKTQHAKIFIGKNRRIPAAEVEHLLREVMSTAELSEAAIIREALFRALTDVEQTGGPVRVSAPALPAVPGSA